MGRACPHVLTRGRVEWGKNSQKFADIICEQSLMTCLKNIFLLKAGLLALHLNKFLIVLHPLFILMVILLTLFV